MGNKISAFIVDSEQSAIEVLKLYLKDFENIEIVNVYNDLRTAYNEVVKANAPLLITDIPENLTQEYLDVLNKLISSNKNSKVLVNSVKTSTDLIIKIMRAGCRDFLPKPIIKSEFIKSVKKLEEQYLGGFDNRNNCKVITTFSNKGGIGKTSIATNLALELANITKEKVALIDLNFQLGDVTSFLDVVPSFDISYLVKNLASNESEGFLLSTLEQYKDTSLYILADPPNMEQAKEITIQQISDLFEALKKVFSYVIVDTNANMDGKTITVLDNSDLILLVSIVNLPAIRNCQRCLDAFDRLGYDKEKIKIVVNRYMENDELKIEDVEKALSEKVYWKIPNNYFTIMSAINKGLPVSAVNNESNIAQSYRELATNLSDNIYRQAATKKIARNPLINLKNII